MKPRRRILVIDDTPEDRALVRRFLLSDREADHFIEEASTGEEGLALCQRGGYDVVLLDLHMPGLDGLGVLRKLRIGNLGPPVVVLTVSQPRTLANAALELGAVDFVVKDELTPTGLARAISNAIIRAALQRKLEESLSRSTRLLTLSSALSSADTPVKVIDILLGNGLEAAAATAGFVALLAEDGEHLSIAGSRGYSPEDIAHWQLLALEAVLPAPEAARTGRLVTCATTAECIERYPALRQTERTGKSMAALPLVAGDEILGVLGISFSVEREFTAADLAFLHLLARVCEQALLRARTQEGERRANEQLRIIAERYRALVEAGTPVIWRTDERGQTVSMTPAWQDLTGQTEEDVKGSGWLEAIHPEDQERTRRIWNESLATSSIFVNEFRVRDRRGGWRRHEARAVPVLERPTVRAVLAEPDPDLRIFRQVRATADVLGSAAGLLNIARAAAAVDPELAALWEDFDAERRAVLRALVGSLARDGALRAGVAPIAATDAAAVVLGPETWSALVTQRGWRALEWARWAHRQLAAELLGRLPDDVRP